MSTDRLVKTLKLLYLVEDVFSIMRTARTVGYQSTKDLDVSKTKSYKKLEQIERDLNKKLEKIFASIMTQAEIYNKTVDQLKRENNARIKQTVREAIQSAYIAGSNYVTKTNKTNQIPVFITERDIENIRKHTDTFVAALWRKVETTIQQRQAAKMFPPTTLQGKPTTPLEKGTISIPFVDFQDTITTEPTEPTLDPVSVAVPALSATLLNIALHSAVTSKLEQTRHLRENIHKLKWVSEHDSKVCPICQALDGEEWSEDDPFLKRPGPEDLGGSSHHNCRCRLLLVDDDSNILADE